MSEQHKATAEDIAKHPWDYGMHWVWDAISYVKSGVKVLLRAKVPRIAVRPDQVPAFLAAFGSKVVADALNGTSIDVKCEQIARTMLLRDSHVPDLAIQVRMIDSILLGNVTRVAGTRTYFVGSDGKQYTSAEAATRAAENAAKIADLERVQQFLADATDRGMDMDLARTAARLMFPAVYEALDKIEAERQKDIVLDKEETERFRKMDEDEAKEEKDEEEQDRS